MTGSRRERVMTACGNKPGAVEDYPFGDEVAVYKVGGPSDPRPAYVLRAGKRASLARQGVQTE